jgi:hypothetical protein
MKNGFKFLDIDIRQIIVAFKPCPLQHIIKQVSGKNQGFLDAESLRSCHKLKIAAGTEKKKVIFLRQKHDIVLPDVERTFLNMLQRQKIGIDAPHVASAFHF